MSTINTPRPRNSPLSQQTSYNGSTSPRQKYLNYSTSPNELHVTLANPEITGFTPEEEAEYAEKFNQTLENAQPDQVMAAMIHPRSAKLVSILPETVFISALHLLTPAHFILPYRDLHHALHPWSTLLAGVKRLESRFDSFTRNLLTIRQYRLDGPHPLGLAEYTHLLACAAAMGNEPLAHEIWHSIWRAHLFPDAACAAHFTDALVWSHCYDGAPAYRLRPLERNLRNRSYTQWRSWYQNVRGPDWAGFGAGAYDVKVFVQDLMRSRQALGHPADERMYVGLMLGAARTGDYEKILEVLNMGWNVDVRALMSGEGAEVEAVPLEKGSALYPSQHLLFGIAHALGTNSDIGGALHAIRFIADSYGIPISGPVWLELLERAFVLSRPRTRGRDAEAASAGQVSTALVRTIFRTMTGEPYAVTPNMLAWRFMMKISITDGSLDEFREYLQGAYELLCKTREQQEQAYETVIQCLRPGLDMALRHIKRQGHEVHSRNVLHGTDFFDCPHLSDAIHAYEIIRLEVYQQEYLLKRSVYNGIQARRWEGITEEGWYFQERPELMQEWKEFLPENIILTTPDGSKARFKGRTNWSSRIWHRGRNAPIKRVRQGRELFAPTQKPVWQEEVKWENVLSQYPFLVDKKVAPGLVRLFKFRKEPSEKLTGFLERLRTTDVQYPSESPLSAKNNPHGPLYGRIAALGMLKSTSKSVYRLDDAQLG